MTDLSCRPNYDAAPYTRFIDTVLMVSSVSRAIGPAWSHTHSQLASCLNLRVPSTFPLSTQMASMVNWRGSRRVDSNTVKGVSQTLTADVRGNLQIVFCSPWHAESVVNRKLCTYLLKSRAYMRPKWLRRSSPSRSPSHLSL